MDPYVDNYELSRFPDPGLILEIMEEGFDLEMPTLPEGMEIPSAPQNTPAMAGAASAAPAIPAVEESMPVAAPAPKAPKPPAGVGASDGLSQLQQKTNSSEDSRADSLFEE